MKVMSRLVVVVWTVPLVSCTIVANPMSAEDAGARGPAETETSSKTGHETSSAGEASGATSDGGEGTETTPGKDTGTTADDSQNDSGAAPEVNEGDAGSEGATAEDVGTESADKPAFDCGTADMENAQLLKGVITDDQHWSGTYLVEGEVSVNGATITIAPGTNLVMKADSLINFGGNNTGGTLQAEGTLDEPITFCGEEDEPAYWNFISIREGVTTNSKLTNVLVRGGSVGLHAEVLVQNLVLEDSRGDAMAADTFKAGSDGLFISGSEGLDVVMGAPAAATRFPTRSSLSTGVRIDFDRVATSETFHNLGVPYLTGSISVLESGSLTIEAGVELQFAADSAFTYGAFAGEATAMILGTEQQPVVFRGQVEEPGFWRGVRIDDEVLTNSKIEHLTLKHAGSEEVNALVVAAPIEVSHLRLEGNASSAHISSAGLKSTSTDWKITDSKYYPLSVEVSALLSLPTNSHYAGNGEDFILVSGNRIESSGTIAAQDVPFKVADGLSIISDAKLTIEPGCVFLMGADTIVDVGPYLSQSTLTAIGTEDAPIVFKGDSDTAGFWSGMLIQSEVSTDSALQWVEIHDAGGESLDAALQLELSLPVSNCTFAQSAGWGLLKQDTDVTDYETENTFEGNTTGTVGSL